MNIFSGIVEMQFISKTIIYEFKKFEYPIPNSFCVNTSTMWLLREYLLYL